MDILRTAGGRAAAGLERWSSRLRATPGPLPAHDDDELGQGLAEYALILALIAIVCIAALAFFGLQISAVLTDPVGADISGVLSRIGP
jgi:Flp pilus assembly pilin Flp